MLKVALIVGSTRPNRFADIVVEWMARGAAERGDFQLEILDLREAVLPFLDEPIPPSLLAGNYATPEANIWRSRLGKCDGYIVTVAEYNHGPTAVLKNAFDSACNEWVRKPIAFVGYGNSGGTRAIEQLRSVAVGLQMAPLHHEVNIHHDMHMAVANGEKRLDDYANLCGARTEMFDNLVWWTGALRTARNKLRLVR